MKNHSNLEIEYKYLIHFPDLEVLTNQDGCRVAEIVQTYLRSESGMTSRVRKWVENGVTAFYSTDKKRISFQTSEEYEKEITEDEYSMLLLKADKACTPILKTRYIIPYCNHNLEIDIYPFRNKQAVLEIEINTENEEVQIPPYLSVIKDVSGDRRYSNHSLAKIIPDEE